MKTGSDGVEVAATAQDAEDWPLAPLLVLDNLGAYLDRINQGTGPIRWERIGDGHSNITYRLQRKGVDLVLRRGPRPPFPRSAHDMVREARIQTILGGQGLPTPQIIDVCEDDSVLGVPFYLMTWLDGTVVTDSVPTALNSPADRRNISRSAIDALVRVHSLPIDEALGSFGRPDGYLRRQIERFSSLWEINTTRALPEVARLGDWLLTNLPATQRHAVVHGDFRIGNLMFASDTPARVTAILDWEMATVGDPLADLGYFTATYADPHSPATPMELTPVTREEGFLTRTELVDRYVAETSLDVSNLPWYQCLALWKASVFCEAIYTRYLRGERPGDTVGPALKEGIPAMLELAHDLAYAGGGLT